MKLEKRLGEHFDPEAWSGYESFKNYEHAGINLVEEINSLNPDLVIDVGCGKNRFKGHIQNLIGFDQSPFPFVDIVSTIQDINFREESADVCLGLGSIQFGTRDEVIADLEKVLSWIKPGGYLVMRTMNQWFHPNRDYPHWDHQYLWTREDVEELGKIYNLELIKGIWEDFVPAGIRGKQAGYKYKSSRLVWWWQKPGARKTCSINIDTCEIEENDV